MNKAHIWELTASLSIGWAFLMAMLIPNVIGTICMGVGLVAYVQCTFKEEKEKASA